MKTRELFTGMFAFVSQNPVVDPSNLAKISKKFVDKIAHLLDVINKGDTQDEIYKDPMCTLFVLCLMQDRLIPFWQGCTVYRYLMGLMEYTGEHPVATTDAKKQNKNTGLIRQFSIEKLVHENKLTPQGESYVNSICTNFNRIGIKINREKLVAFILLSDPVDQWLFIVEFQYRFIRSNPLSGHDSLYDDHCEHIKKLFPSEGKTFYLITHATCPYVGLRNKDQSYYFEVPSLTLSQYLHRTYFPEGYQSQPFFGKVGEDIFNGMRKIGIHLIQLYSPFIKHNKITAHELEFVGGATIFHHDHEGHYAEGSMFSGRERNIIFNHFLLPFNYFKDNFPEISNAIILDEISIIADLIVRDTQAMADKERRLEIHFKEIFSLFADRFEHRTRDLCLSPESSHRYLLLASLFICNFFPNRELKKIIHDFLIYREGSDFDHMEERLKDNIIFKTVKQCRSLLEQELKSSPIRNHMLDASLDEAADTPRTTSAMLYSCHAHMFKRITRTIQKKIQAANERAILEFGA